MFSLLTTRILVTKHLTMFYFSKRYTCRVFNSSTWVLRSFCCAAHKFNESDRNCTGDKSYYENQCWELSSCRVLNMINIISESVSLVWILRKHFVNVARLIRKRLSSPFVARLWCRVRVWLSSFYLGIESDFKTSGRVHTSEAFRANG